MSVYSGDNVLNCGFCAGIVRGTVENSFSVREVKVWLVSHMPEYATESSIYSPTGICWYENQETDTNERC